MANRTTTKTGLTKAGDVLNGVLPFVQIDTTERSDGPAVEMSSEAPQPLPARRGGARDHKAETAAASYSLALKAAELRLARDNETLGDDVFKLAQTMILCTLPYRPTAERQITKKARLADRSTLSVTFTAGREGVPLPYGADRKLLTWMVDRCIKSDVPLIQWQSALEYIRDVGLTNAGKNLRDLKQRFRRLAGLVITIERKSLASERVKMLAFIEESNLPRSIDVEAERRGQDRLPAVREQYGFLMNDRFSMKSKRTTLRSRSVFGLRLDILGAKCRIAFCGFCTGATAHRAKR